MQTWASLDSGKSEGLELPLISINPLTFWMLAYLSSVGGAGLLFYNSNIPVSPAQLCSSLIFSNHHFQLALIKPFIKWRCGSLYSLYFKKNGLENGSYLMMTFPTRCLLAKLCKVISPAYLSHPWHTYDLILMVFSLAFQLTCVESAEVPHSASE